MPGKLGHGGPASLSPLFLVDLSQRDRAAIVQLQDGLDLVVQPVDRIVVFVQRLDIKHRGVVAVLSEQQPRPRIVKCGLAGSVVTVNVDVGPVGHQLELPATLKVAKT